MTDDEEVLVQERFWNGAWKQVLLRLTLILGIMLMGVGGYSAVWRIQHPRTDTPPQRCRDYATIIMSGGAQRCDEGARLDTTRLQEPGRTDVLVRCLCNGHETLPAASTDLVTLRQVPAIVTEP